MSPTPKLALHRSITFWCGLVVIASICLAWWDSPQRSRYLVKSRWSLVSFGSGLGLERGSDFSDWDMGVLPAKDFVAVDFPATMKLRFARPFFVNATDGDVYRDKKRMRDENAHGDGELEPMMAMYLSYSPTGGSSGDWDLFVPYWLLLAGFAVPWIAMLLWRARRRRSQCQVIGEQ